MAPGPLQLRRAGAGDPLYLNPTDNQGAREVLADIRAHRRWHPGIADSADHHARSRVLTAARHPRHAQLRAHPGSLRTLPTADARPAPDTVAHAVRRAAAEALYGSWDGRSPHIVIGPPRGGIKVRVVARHQRGHSLAPDEYWWDAHTADQEIDGPVLLVLVADPGYVALAQLLRADQLAAYREAEVPRRDRTAFTTTFIHGDTHFGTDLTSPVDHALDILPGPGQPQP